MTHIYLIRHANSIEGQLPDGKYGDLGLAPEGVIQAEKLRDRLAATGEIKPDVVIASPARRAHETAQIIAPALHQPITPDAEVEEWRCDDGTLTPEEFTARWNQVAPAQKAYYHWMEGYENRMEFDLRVNLALNRIAQEHAGKIVVIVSHGGFIQLSFKFFFGFGETTFERASTEIRHTSITHWYKSQSPERWILERANDHHHLG